MTFHFVLLKIPSFARVIGFSFIPNIRTIDNKVEAGGDKIFVVVVVALSGDSNPGILRGCCMSRSVFYVVPIIYCGAIMIANIIICIYCTIVGELKK